MGCRVLFRGYISRIHIRHYFGYISGTTSDTYRVTGWVRGSDQLSSARETAVVRVGMRVEFVCGTARHEGRRTSVVGGPPAHPQGTPCGLQNRGFAAVRSSGTARLRSGRAWCLSCRPSGLSKPQRARFYDSRGAGDPEGANLHFSPFFASFSAESVDSRRVDIRRADTYRGYRTSVGNET